MQIISIVLPILFFIIETVLPNSNNPLDGNIYFAYAALLALVGIIISVVSFIKGKRNVLNVILCIVGVLFNILLIIISAY